MKTLIELRIKPLCITMLFLFTLNLIVACGGGGGGSNTPPASTSKSSAKLQISASLPPNSANSLISSNTTSDGITTSFWGKTDGSGLPTGITKSFTYGSDPSKGFVTLYDAGSHPVMLYNVATGYSTRLVYQANSIVALFYDENGSYLSGCSLAWDGSKYTSSTLTDKSYTINLPNANQLSLLTPLPLGVGVPSALVATTPKVDKALSVKKVSYSSASPSLTQIFGRLGTIIVNNPQ